jgi:hypothetical protein
MPPAQRPAPIPQTAPPPSDGRRSVISFLIFLHFVFLLVGIKAHTGTPSALDQDLANKVPGLNPYLELLAMNTDYMFDLTDYDINNPNQFSDDGTQFRPVSTDFVVEVDVPQADGSIQTITWPVHPYVKASLGRVRLNSLLSQLVVQSELDNENAEKLSFVVAKRIMAETQCGEASKRQPMTVRFRRRLLQILLPDPTLTPEENKRILAEEYARDPLDPDYLQTSFEVLAFLTADNEFQATTKKAASNTAAPAGAPSSPTGPRPTATPSGTGASS